MGEVLGWSSQAQCRPSIAVTRQGLSRDAQNYTSLCSSIMMFCTKTCGSTTFPLWDHGCPSVPKGLAAAVTLSPQHLGGYL